MATIKAAIALYDGVTNPLKSMNRAMNIVINSFESLQRTASNAVDTSAIKEAREELAKAETAFDGIEQSIREIDQQQQKVNRSISKGENAASRFWSKCKGAALALGGMFTANKILETSDALVSTNARLQNVLVQFDDNGKESHGFSTTFQKCLYGYCFCHSKNGNECQQLIWQFG